MDQMLSKPARMPATARVASIGHPFSTTLAGSLGFAISCLQQGPVDIVFFWTVYTFWAVSTTFVIAFSIFLVAPGKRIHYLFLLLSMEGIVLAILAAASAPSLNGLPRHLLIWGPMQTVLCAGAATLPFDRYNPDSGIRTSDEEQYKTRNSEAEWVGRNSGTGDVAEEFWD